MHSPPEADEGNETHLMPVCPDRIAEYQNEIVTSPSIELWQRIERSVTLSPFLVGWTLFELSVGESIRAIAGCNGHSGRNAGFHYPPA